MLTKQVHQKSVVFATIEILKILLKWCFTIFLLYIKMSKCNSVELTYYQRKRGVILNKAKDYYENDKKTLREQARDKYRNLSEEEEKKEEI